MGYEHSQIIFSQLSIEFLVSSVRLTELKTKLVFEHTHTITIPIPDYETLSNLTDTGYHDTIKPRSIYLLPIQCTKL